MLLWHAYNIPYISVISIKWADTKTQLIKCTQKQRIILVDGKYTYPPGPVSQKLISALASVEHHSFCQIKCFPALWTSPLLSLPYVLFCFFTSYSWIEFSISQCSPAGCLLCRWIDLALLNCIITSTVLSPANVVRQPILAEKVTLFAYAVMLNS